MCLVSYFEDKLKQAQFSFKNSGYAKSVYLYNRPSVRAA